MAANEAKDTPNSFSSKMRAARLSNQQFDVLIQFMRRYPTLALGRAAGGSYCKEEHDFLWRSLTSQLNDTEGPAKSISKWQKCWVDLKSNARSRAAKVRAFCIDGAAPPGTTFTPWDEHVLKLLGEINPRESPLPIELQKQSSHLVEVPLTSGKVVLMEVNGEITRNNKSNGDSVSSKSANHHQDNVFARKQTIKVEEIDDEDNDNFNLIEEVHDVEDDGVTELDPLPDVDEFHKNDEDHLEASENEYLLCPSVAPIQTSNDMLNALNVCSPSRSEINIPCKEREDLFQKQYSNKRKRNISTSKNELEDSLERFSKKICTALERVAMAAEESNALQRGIVGALDRLSSSLEQLVPIVAKGVTTNSSSS